MNSSDAMVITNSDGQVRQKSENNNNNSNNIILV